MSRADTDDLRTLRKRLLVAQSALMRERLAQELHRSTHPLRLARNVVASSAASSLPVRSLLSVALPWLYGRLRKRRTAKKVQGKA